MIIDYQYMHQNNDIIGYMKFGNGCRFDASGTLNYDKEEEHTRYKMILKRNEIPVYERKLVVLNY